MFLSTKDSSGQFTHLIGLGPELGLPGKNFGESNLGVGGSLQYQLKLNAPVGIQVHVGYVNFVSKTEFFSDMKYKISFLPVRAGILGFIYKDIIFVSADAGISKYHANTGTDQTGFSFGFGGGYKYIIAKKHFAQLSVLYNSHNFQDKQIGQNFNYNWFSLRLAYGMQWSKQKETRD